MAPGRMNSSQCSLDPNRREVRVTALTDDKALLIVSCEAGAYNTVDLAWLVSRQKPFSASQPVRLRLPFTPDNGNDEMELMNARFDEKSARADHALAGARYGRLWVSRRAGVLTASVSAWCVTLRNRPAITGTGQMPGPRCGSRARARPTGVKERSAPAVTSWRAAGLFFQYRSAPSPPRSQR